MSSVALAMLCILALVTLFAAAMSAGFAAACRDEKPRRPQWLWEEFDNEE